MCVCVLYVTMPRTARTTWSQWSPMGVLVPLSMPHVAFVGRYAFLTTKSCLTSHPTAPAHLHFARERMCVRCCVVLFGHGMVNSHACMMPTSNHIYTLVSINASPLHGVGPTREPKHSKKRTLRSHVLMYPTAMPPKDQRPNV